MTSGLAQSLQDNALVFVLLDIVIGIILLCWATSRTANSWLIHGIAVICLAGLPSAAAWLIEGAARSHGVRYTIGAAANYAVLYISAVVAPALYAICAAVILLLSRRSEGA
jgi:hypothetical protein